MLGPVVRAHRRWCAPGSGRLLSANVQPADHIDLFSADERPGPAHCKHKPFVPDSYTNLQLTCGTGCSRRMPYLWQFGSHGDNVLQRAILPHLSCLFGVRRDWSDAARGRYASCTTVWFPLFPKICQRRLRNVIHPARLIQRQNVCDAGRNGRDPLVAASSQLDPVVNK